MNGIKWPKMFNSNSTNVWKSAEYKKSTKQNIITLLQTNRNELFGDPYFGLTLKSYYFSPNSYILKDMLIDVIYTQLALFIPQIKVERKNIEIVQDKEKGKLYLNFRAISQIDYNLDTYNLELFDANKAIA